MYGYGVYKIRHVCMYVCMYACMHACMYAPSLPSMYAMFVSDSCKAQTNVHEASHANKVAMLPIFEGAKATAKAGHQSDTGNKPP